MFRVLGRVMVSRHPTQGARIIGAQGPVGNMGGNRAACVGAPPPFLSSTAPATPSGITWGCDRCATPSHSGAPWLASAYKQPVCTTASQAVMAKGHNLTQTCKQVIHKTEKFFLQIHALFCRRAKTSQAVDKYKKKTC